MHTEYVCVCVCVCVSAVCAVHETYFLLRHSHTRLLSDPTRAFMHLDGVPIALV